MADPQLIVCNKDVWTKVATDVKTGVVWIKKTTTRYFQTYRDTGNDAPDDTVEAWADEGIPVSPDGHVISADAGIDVYIYCPEEDGNIRLDL